MNSNEIKDRFSSTSLLPSSGLVKQLEAFKPTQVVWTDETYKTIYEAMKLWSYEAMKVGKPVDLEELDTIAKKIYKN